MSIANEDEKKEFNILDEIDMIDGDYSEMPEIEKERRKVKTSEKKRDTIRQKWFKHRIRKFEKRKERKEALKEYYEEKYRATSSSIAKHAYSKKIAKLDSKINLDVLAIKTIEEKMAKVSKPIKIGSSALGFITGFRDFVFEHFVTMKSKDDIDINDIDIDENKVNDEIEEAFKGISNEEDEKKEETNTNTDTEEKDISNEEPEVKTDLEDEQKDEIDKMFENIQNEENSTDSKIDEEIEKAFADISNNHNADIQEEKEDKEEVDFDSDSKDYETEVNEVEDNPEEEVVEVNNPIDIDEVVNSITPDSITDVAYNTPIVEQNANSDKIDVDYNSIFEDFKNDMSKSNYSQTGIGVNDLVFDDKEAIQEAAQDASKNYLNKIAEEEKTKKAEEAKINKLIEERYEKLVPVGYELSEEYANEIKNKLRKQIEDEAASERDREAREAKARAEEEEKRIREENEKKYASVVMKKIDLDIDKISEEREKYISEINEYEDRIEKLKKENEVFLSSQAELEEMINGYSDNADSYENGRVR